MKENLERADIQIYRLAELKKLLGVGRSTIYYWIKQGKFPKPIKLGDRVSGWLKTDILKWIEERARKTK